MPVQPKRGLLVVIEGIDGAGKTTLRRALAARLCARGEDVLETKEPTDGPLGQQIRAIAATGRARVSPEEELHLFHEDRRLHVEGVVRPALARGAVVLQDRSYFSTIAYQGERGLDRPRILAESQRIAPAPDVLLVVDIPAEVAIERIRQSRAQPADDFETLESLRNVRRVFCGFSEAIRLDGLAPPDVLVDAADRAVIAALERVRRGESPTD